ncbi:PAS domain S-box protein [Anaerospora sp.]|uniref:PAS domain S-box protein n=1 Tax=Anaerospora sp. TaxID=1960278 RepID=UPI0028A1D48F|nr:PAS domain S-box protein [Anaerospora sp.]
MFQNNHCNLIETGNVLLTLNCVLFHHRPEALLMCTGHGIILTANPAACTMFGLTKQELIKAGRQGLIDPADPRAGRSLQQLEKNNCTTIELTLMRSDGSKFPAILSSAKFEDRTGRIITILSILDMTNHYKVQENYGLAIEQLRAIFENATDAIAIFDLDGILVQANKGFEEIFGWPLAEVLDQRLPVTPPDTMNHAEYMVKMVSAGESIKDFETTKICKDGTRVDVSISMSPLRNSYGKIHALVAIVRDITDRKKMQAIAERAEKLHLVGQMAAGIAHEVRNPMTTVRGYLQMLQRRPENEYIASQLHLMIEEIDRANSIITEFLSLAKDKRVHLETKNINQLIETIYPLIEANALEKDRVIKIELGHTSSLLIDQHEITQLLLNLLQNAIEATDKGDTIKILTWEEQDQVYLAIENTGPIIPPEIINSLGTPFFTTKDSGTGLGLAVCYSIAERHHANLSVESQENRTRFTVKFTVP